MKYKKFRKDAVTPEYKTSGSAGMDLYTLDRCLARAGVATKIDTGIGFDIPGNHYVMITSRSSTAIKKSLHVITGTIDSDYTGSISIVVTPIGNKDIVVKAQECIAQAVLIPISSDKVLEETNEFKVTDRGNGAFGSTDK